MPSRIVVDADLRLAIGLPDDREVAGQLTGSGSALTLAVDDPRPFGGRGDASAVRLVADVLAQGGLTVTVVAPSGPLVTLGAPRPPWWQRRVTGSGHIRIERPSALWTLALGRLRGSSRVLPSGTLTPPGTPWPLVPTSPRRRRRVTTTHDPAGGGGARLVLAPDEHPGPHDLRRVFWLLGPRTTIGSDPSCDVVLPGLDPVHAEVRHDDRDEYVIVRRTPTGVLTLHGAPVEEGLLRTGTRIGLGPLTLSFSRDEYADHGRPYGGRAGGELGQQRAQPRRWSSQPPPGPDGT